MKNFCVTVLASLILATGLPADNGEAKTTLRKAREYLGSDLKLQRINTLHYEGTIEEFNPEGESRQGEVIITFAKPMKQRLEVHYPNISRVTVIDDFEGYTKTSNGERTVRNFLTSDVTRSLQANTRENLNFFSSQEDSRRRIIDGGRVEFEGQECHMVVVTYSDEDSFIRYFDPETGKLVVTMTEDGRYIKESGEIMSDGIRFPQRLETFSEEGTLLNRVTFKSIEVNKDLDKELFAMPPMF